MASSKLKTLTLGCKVNQYETEYLREGLHSIGFSDADKDEGADLCIVNTCTVTNEGDSKSRQIIRKMAKENPTSNIVVMGCYATRAPEEVRQLPNVVEVVTDKRELPDILGRFGVVDIPTGISSFGNRKRAYIKVQDGCLLKCSYCIIPSVRPNVISRPPGHILDEVRRLYDSGHQEMVLTGVHLGHYGVEQNKGKPKKDWLRLHHLLEKMVKIPGDFRLRLSSIEATEITHELIDVLVANPEKICPHMHVCLQSGSDRILRLMRRRWGTKRFIDRCHLLQERLDLPALTTDLIVGFPGETDEEFQQSCDVSRAVGFSKIHAFPFSARRTTPAADMAGQLSKKEKQGRIRRLIEVERELKEEYHQKLVGRNLTVLAESPSREKEGHLVGTSCRYAPVEFAADESMYGQLVEVTIVHADSEKLSGIVVNGL
ncbi:MAG: tRNA (N(6)-L-threonylcarbamoyladenosine(37)-C(2))-methylthiotransferase MtaB [Pirellulaceae bacterium]|nr:tRNA (N(6)-L-threonylcarbamoyladenosine(37)-C(2))-methylthiotransferase MtaB [Pirellulaceae bacterium]